MYEELCKAGSCTEARAIIEGRDWFEGCNQLV